MRVLSCLLTEHNLFTVLLAAVICCLGSLVGMRLLRRSLDGSGLLRASWIFLTAMCLGCTIWATHFVAMLGYQPAAPVTLDAGMTALSALIILGGGAVAVFLSGLGRHWARLTAGAGLGLAVSAMHFVGMFAYRVDGLVVWDNGYIAASITVAMAGGAAALWLADRYQGGWKCFIPAGALTAGVVGLHFTGMAAFMVVPMDGVSGAMTSDAFLALALAVTAASLLVVGAGASGYVIERALTERADEELHHMALHDGVTGLLNRVGFDAALQAQIGAHASVALVLLDLKGFKAINDRHGDAVGNTVLAVIGHRLAALEPDGVAARLGADEFALALPLAGQTDLEARLQALRAKVLRPVSSAGDQIEITARIGVAAAPEDGPDAASLLRNATLAVHRAKTDPTGELCHYNAALGDAVRHERELLDALKTAIDLDALTLHYQPQTDIATGDPVGYEALVRWNRPETGPVSPADFIPLAEKNGMICALGDLVLRRACAEAARWPHERPVAVNVSAVQLSSRQIVDTILEALLASGLPPSRLEIELTETALINDLDLSLHILRQIKALGVSIALDDFGTGFSSLETLRQFPFDKIKLDKSFLDDLTTDPRTGAVIRAITQLGCDLQTPVLAEGVETLDQLYRLNEIGCTQAQGYLIGRPGPMVDDQPPEPARLKPTAPKARSTRAA